MASPISCVPTSVSPDRLANRSLVRKPASSAASTASLMRFCGGGAAQRMLHHHGTAENLGNGVGHIFPRVFWRGTAHGLEQAKAAARFRPCPRWRWPKGQLNRRQPSFRRLKYRRIGCPLAPRQTRVGGAVPAIAALSTYISRSFHIRKIPPRAPRPPWPSTSGWQPAHSIFSHTRHGQPTRARNAKTPRGRFARLLAWCSAFSSVATSVPSTFLPKYTSPVNSRTIMIFKPTSRNVFAQGRKVRQCGAAHGGAQIGEELKILGEVAATRRLLGAFWGGRWSHCWPPTEPKKMALLTLQSSSVSAGNGSPALSMAAPPTSPCVHCSAMPSARAAA